jgi:hypothetical protein
MFKMAAYSRAFHLVASVLITCVIDLNLSESIESPAAFVLPRISPDRLLHPIWKRPLSKESLFRAHIPISSASRCRWEVGTLSLAMSRSKESDEIVFVPGQTPKSQPRRGSGSKWEQWFGALEETPADGRVPDDVNAAYSSGDNDIDAASIKNGDNLKRLQSATHNSLDWKVRTSLIDLSLPMIVKSRVHA